MKRKLSAAVLAVALVTGCHTKHNPDKRLTQAQADYLALSILAAQINAAQTNFVLKVEPADGKSWQQIR